MASLGAHLGTDLMPDHSRGTAKVMAQLSGLGTAGDVEVSAGVQLIHVLNGRDPLRTDSTKIDLPTQPGHNVLLLCAGPPGSPAYADPGTYVFTGFTMRGTGPVPEFDLSQQPCLFLLAPPATDALSGTTGPLLDFFVLNCTLAPNGYSVEATIDGTIFRYVNGGLSASKDRAVARTVHACGSLDPMDKWSPALSPMRANGPFVCTSALPTKQAVRFSTTE